MVKIIDNSYAEYNTILSDIIIEKTSGAGNDSTGSWISNVPQILCTRNDREVLLAWKSNVWELMNQLNYKPLDRSDTIMYDKLAVCIISKMINQEVSIDSNKGAFANILEYLKTTLPWAITLYKFITLCAFQDEEILTLLPNTDHTNSVEESELIKLLPILKRIQFNDQRIDCIATLQMLNLCNDEIYINDNISKFILRHMAARSFHELDVVNPENIGAIDMESALLECGSINQPAMLLYSTIGIILNGGTEQIRILESLWSMEAFARQKNDVYNRYGGTIFSAIMIAHPDRISSLINLFTSGLDTEEMNTRFNNMCTNIFMSIPSSRLLEDHLGGYSGDFANIDEENIEDTTDIDYEKVYEDIATSLLILVFSGNRNNLDCLFSYIAPQQQSLDGVVEQLFVTLACNFNNSGNVSRLFHMDSLYSRFLSSSHDNYVTLDFIQYLWDKLLPAPVQSLSAQCIPIQGAKLQQEYYGKMYKLAWVFFHLAFKSINVVESLEYLYSKLELHTEVVSELLSIYFPERFLKTRSNKEIDDGLLKENWLSVRLCEIAAIRQDQGQEILEWLEKRTSDTEMCKALTNGMWAFNKAIADNNLEIIEFIWNKVSILDKTSLINLLINKESYQPETQLAFLKFSPSSVDSSNTLRTLSWIFNKINEHFDEMIKCGMIDEQVLKTSLLIAFRKAMVFNDKKVALFISDEILSKGGELLLKQALYGEEGINGEKVALFMNQNDYQVFFADLKDSQQGKEFLNDEQLRSIQCAGEDSIVYWDGV